LLLNTYIFIGLLFVGPSIALVIKAGHEHSTHPVALTNGF